ncbi:hypothetical protein EYF80_019156 [Liparis tanakae]|uniref:Uncharacterized protein n=1 Tax=Liparis tanakae TaxID=230148 RepID=A0A4Z2I017_9TELE|nr:hypothetical protein EYF80_019156 [Liparis tanakae]
MTVSHSVMQKDDLTEKYTRVTLESDEEEAQRILEEKSRTSILPQLQLPWFSTPISPAAHPLITRSLFKPFHLFPARWSGMATQGSLVSKKTQRGAKQRCVSRIGGKEMSPHSPLEPRQDEDRLNSFPGVELVKRVNALATQRRLSPEEGRGAGDEGGDEWGGLYLKKMKKNVQPAVGVLNPCKGGNLALRVQRVNWQT